MRAALVFAMLAACGGGGQSPVETAKGGELPLTMPPPPVPPMPRVDASVVVEPTVLKQPAAVVFIAADNARAVGRVATPWRGELPAERQSAYTDDDVRKLISAGVGLDDPPPEEDDESGTAMALEEGKMGKQESDRSEGAYKMRKEDPDVARQQAIEQARAAGILGPGGRITRTGTASGWPLAELAHVPLYVADPAAAAAGLAGLIAETGGAIAVARDGGYAVLAHGFRHTSSASAVTEPWVELHLDDRGIHVVVPGKDPSTVAWPLDRADLLALVARARGSAQLPIDVRVAAGAVTVQQLIDVLATFNEPVALGMLPTTSAERVQTLEARARLPNVSVGTPAATGDLDKAIIRRYIRRNLPKIQYCYEKELVAKPGLQGTVTVKFKIEPTGVVSSSTASGMDQTAADCVALVIKGIQFPAPKGAGVVDVSYPFTFRPES